MNHHLGTSKESLPRFAVIQEADITAESVIFLQEADHSPFVLTTSSPQSYSTLTLVACTVNRTYPLIGSFSEIDFPKSSSLSADVVISSLTLMSSEVVGSNGLASSTSSHQSHLSLSASLLSCELLNLTSSPSQTTRQSQIVTKQKLAQCHFSSVDNALYGTAISRIDHSSSALCLNTSIVNCLNVNNELTTINENKTITGPTDRYAFNAQSGSFLFSLCNLTTNTPTQETSLIYFSNFTGTLEINGCSFTSKVGATRATSVNVEAITGTFPKITLISSNFTYSQNDNTPNDETQIKTVRPLQLNVINCLFTTPAEDVYSNTRAIRNIEATTYVQIAHCRFLRQSTSGSGGAVAYHNGVHLIHIFDTLFEANKAANEGGSLTLYTAHHKCFRCIFKDCSAGKLGGAIKLYWPYHSYHEDCAFINNTANQTDNLNNLASYRGNDIQIRTNTANAVSTANTIGCTSTSALPRIAYYDNTLQNGVHPQQEIILPLPSAGKGAASLILHVQIGAKGNECSEASPCSTIDTAFGKVGAAFTLIELGLGMFTDSSRTTDKSFELQGRGFISNDTKPTTFTTGGITSTGNITLSAMNIKPATPSTTLLTMTAGQTRLSHVELEDITNHDAYLFSFTGGNAAVRCSTFASMTLKSTAVMSFSGSTTVSFNHCWFYNLVRQSGSGGTCMDSSSTSTIAIDRSDFTNCSSSGRAGCCDFVGSSTSKVTQSLLIFINNSALIQTGGKGNDVFMTGFTTQPSINTNCRSNSTKPHIGQESGTTVTPKNMFFPDLSFSSKGMPHPVAYRIEQGTPLSYFSSFNDILDQCEGTGATIQIQVSGSPWHLTNPHDFNNKKIRIRSLPILCTPQTTEPLFRLRNGGSLNIWQCQFNLNHVIDMPFVKVEDSSSAFSLGEGTLHLTSLSQTRPLFVVKDGSFYFGEVSISKSGPYSQTGCSLIENTGGFITLKDMKFHSFITSSNGSVLNSVGGSVRIYYPMFELCEAKNGGALYVELNGSRNITAIHVASAKSGTTFHSCVAVGDGTSENPTGKGGAIYVKGTSTSSQPIAFYTTNSDDARFEKNRAAEGNDLYVEKSLFESVPTQDLPKFRGGSLSDQHHVVIEGRELANEEEIGISVPFPIISVNGSVVEPTTGVSGSDTENCKWTSSYCSTVRYGIRFLTQKYKNNTLMPMNIKYLWNMTYHEYDIVVASQDITVTGTTTSNQKTSTITRTLVKTNETAAKKPFLFTIEEKAVMTVSNIDYIAPSKHGLFDLTATGESVALDNLAIISEGGVEHIQSMIRTSTGPVSINDCIFNSSSETSAVYSLPVVSLSATDKPFTFDSTSFMSLSMKSSSVIEIETEGEISVKSVKFTNCVRTNTPNGSLVHIKTTGIETKVTPARWAGSFNDSTLLEHFSGLDKGKTETDMWQTTPLLFYLLPSPASAIRMSSSSDQATTHPKCGTTRLPCLTLQSGISSVDTHLQSVLEMATDGSIVESVARTSSLEIKSTSSTKRTITLNDAASFVMNGASKVLLFNTIQFLVDSSCTSPTLFVVQLGTVSLKTCLIGSDSKVSLPATTTKVFEVHNGATLALEASTLQRLSFGSEEAGTLVHLCTGSTFIRDNDSVFSEIESKGKGTIIYVEASSLSTVAGNTSFAPFKSQLPLPTGRLFTTSEKAQFFGKEGSNEWSLLYYWYPHTVSHLTLDVKEDGQDHVNCGISQLPCQTLVHGWSKLKVSGTTLQLSRSDTINTTLTTKFSVLTLTTGSIMSNADQSIFVGTEGSLVVSTNDHTLILQNQKFILESPRSTSAFSISAGSLTINSCFFGEQGTVTTFEASTLIAQSGGNLKLTSCSFTDIVSTGNGSVLNALVPAGKSLIVVDGSVSGCSTTGNGGALHVTLHETGRFEMTGTTGMSFSNCEALVDSSKPENTTGLGQAVHILVKDTASVFTLSKVLFSSTSQPAAEPFLFVQAPSLASSITSTSMAFLSAPFSESDLAKYEGFEDTNLTVRHPLVLFLLDVATGYLKSTGNDSLRCGLDLSPCQTVTRLTSRLLEDSTATGVPQFKILIVDSGLFNSSLVIGQYSLDVEKSAHTASLHMNNGHFSIPSTSTSGLLSVKSLELKWNATPTKILDLAGGQASIDSCSIACTPTTDTFSSATLFSVTDGVLTITSLSLDMQEKKVSSVVALNGGAVVLSDCTFEKGKLQASLIDGTGSITLPAGTFTSLVDSSDTQAHAISSIVTSDQTVSIGSSSMTTSFTSCSSSGNGGALHVKVSGTGSLSVTHTSFSLCSSSENGGAVSLDLSSMGSNQFTFTSVGFGSLGANSNGLSKKGQNVFVVLAQAQIPSLLTSDKWTGSYLSSPANSVAFTESEKNLIAFSAQSDTRWSLLHVLFAYASGDVFVDSSNGESNAICGQSVLPCSSLSQGYSNLVGSSVKVRSSIDLDNSITSKAGSTSIASNDASIRSVSVLSGKGITISTGTVTFSSLKFILTASGIASPVWTVNGGVLNVGSTVTITNPLSSAEHVSNVILVSSGTLSVTSLVLDFTTKLSLKGSSLISQSGGIITWNNVSTSSVSSVLDGSASGTTIHSSIGSGSSLTIGSSSTTTSFTSCSSSGNGGALHVKVSGTGSLSVTHTSFSLCSSSENGGAIFVDLSSLTASQIATSQPTLSHLSFGVVTQPNNLNQCGSTQFGRDVFVSMGIHNLDSVNLPNWSGSYFTRASGNTTVFDTFERDSIVLENENEHASILYLVNKCEGSELSVKTGGVDHSRCGHVLLPCSSLPHSYSVAKGVTETVVVGSALPLSKTITTIEKSTIIRSEDLSTQTITVDVSCGFILAKGTLQFSSLALISSGSQSRVLSLITVSESATLSINSCAVSGFVSSTSGSIISGTIKSTLSISKTNFTSCSSSQNGGVLSIALADASGKIALNEVLFTSCDCAIEKVGRCVYLSKPTFGSGDVVMKALTFQTSVQTDSHEVYISGASLISLNTHDSWQSTIPPELSLDTESMEEVWGSDTGIEHGNGPFSYFLYPHLTGNVAVNTLFWDHIHCGSNYLPCASLERGVLSLKEQSKVVLLKTAVPLKTSITPLQASQTIDGDSSLQIVTVSLLGQFSLPNSRELRLKSLQFVFSSTEAPTQSLLKVDGGSLTVSSCRFGSADSTIPTTLCTVSNGLISFDDLCSIQTNSVARSKPLFVLSGGQTQLASTTLPISTLTSTASEFDISQSAILILKSLTLNFQTQSVTSFVRLNQGTVELTDSVISNGTMLSSFIQGNGNVSISGTTFSNLSVSQSSNSGIHPIKLTIDSQQTVTIGCSGKDTSFTSCSSNSDGGALNLKVNRGTLSLIAVSFVSCSSTGKGGAIFLDTPSAPTIQMSSCYFASNKAADVNDVFADDGWRSILSNDTIVDCFSDSNFHHLVIGNKPDNDLIPLSVLGVDTSSQDSEDCRLPLISCRTVSKSLSFCVQKEKDDVTLASRIIEMEEGEYQEAVLEVNDKRVTIRGKAKKTVTLSSAPSSNSLVVVTSGSATLRSLTLKSKNPSSAVSFLQLGTGSLLLDTVLFDGKGASLASPLIESTHAGSLSLIMAIVKNITFADHPLIQANCSVFVSNSLFEEIERQSGQGSVLEAILCQTYGVTMEHTIFEACSVAGNEDWIVLSGQNGATFKPNSWTGTFSLTHNWDTVRVIEEADAWEYLETYNPYSLVYSFYPRPSNTSIIVSTTPSTQDHPLCGSTELPCHSIESGVGLSGIRVVNIKTSATISSAFTMNGDPLTIAPLKLSATLKFASIGQIVNNAFDEPDALAINSLTLDMSDSQLTSENGAISIECGAVDLQNTTFSSSTPLKCMLVKVTGGWVTFNRISFSISTFVHPTPLVFSKPVSVVFTDVSFSSNIMSTLISLSETEFTMRSSSFETPNVDEAHTDLCEWESGLITLTDCQSHIYSTSFTSLEQGALLISGGNLTLHSVKFEDNSALNATFPSVHHNIQCTDNARITQKAADSNNEDASLWISVDSTGCTVFDGTKEIQAPFFIPTLKSGLSTKKSTKTSVSFNVSIVGEKMIPCGLSLEVFSVAPTRKNAQESVDLPISSLNFSKWTETVIQLNLSSSTLSALPVASAWHGRLVYGNGQYTDSFVIKQSTSDERKSQLRQAMKTILPIILGVIGVLFLLFLLIAIFICRRRKQKNKTKEKLLSTELDQYQFDEIKFEEPVWQNDGSTVFNEFDHHKSEDPTQSKTKVAKGDLFGNPDLDHEEIPTAEVIALNCGPHLVETETKRLDTLYNRLHGSNKMTLKSEPTLKHVIRGLQGLQHINPQADIFARLSPYMITVSDSGEIQIITPGKGRSTQDLISYTAKVLDEKPHEGKRWESPEVAEGKTPINLEKASVFSLGLILWEIETGNIPFSELDAINASRQIVAGSHPKMEAVVTKSVAELITTCLAYEPSERPTLKELDAALGVLPTTVAPHTEANQEHPQLLELPPPPQ